ncbi:hypothetical protein OOZ51_19835 [Arthrobacter sp. MI7-26]|uniref:hypothetical protein n=1 Tax=Arthrobacter sp. MI7-26 TaxID=2993653 RepID=UPI0022497228|nr:hypothetical protein [Arthrobacter sp. MI7-26]MCX2750041.1 hypothetical protein [Arthrobacter sp. MI7-26]
MSNANPVMTIKVEDPDSRDQQLDQATSLLREMATSCGILVTRIDFTTFTIALSPKIHFGYIREVDLL